MSHAFETYTTYFARNSNYTRVETNKIFADYETGEVTEDALDQDCVPFDEVEADLAYDGWMEDRIGAGDMEPDYEDPKVSAAEAAGRERRRKAARRKMREAENAEGFVPPQEYERIAHEIWGC